MEVCRLPGVPADLRRRLAGRCEPGSEATAPDRVPGIPDPGPLIGMTGMSRRARLEESRPGRWARLRMVGRESAAWSDHHLPKPASVQRILRLLGDTAPERIAGGVPNRDIFGAARAGSTEGPHRRQ